MQEADESEPGAPQQHLVHVLHVDDAEHEDELVEHIVPEFVFDALRFGDAQLPEDETLNAEAEYRQRAIRYVNQGLQQTEQWNISQILALVLKSTHTLANLDTLLRTSTGTSAWTILKCVV